MSTRGNAFPFDRTIRPLQKPGRSREPEVEAQIQQVFDNPRLLWDILEEPDDFPAKRTCPLKEETLVYFLRELIRHGDERGWQIVEFLKDRVAGYIWKCIQPLYKRDRWGSRAQECEEDILSRLTEVLPSMELSHEFWEVRFWCCLRRLVLNIVRPKRREIQTTVPIEVSLNDLEYQEDRDARLIDRHTLTAYQRAIIAEALAQLPDHERTAFVLFHYHEFTQQEIAEQMSVTDRTVRNWLSRAEERLKAWRD